MRYSITASYPSSFEWGKPEEHLERALDLACQTESISEYVMANAGTDLMSGRRDVEFIVKAEQPDALHRVIDSLDDPAERRLWVVLPYDDERGGFDFTTGHGPKLALIPPSAEYAEAEAAGIAAEDAEAEEFERRPYFTPPPVTLREEFRVVVRSPLGTVVNVGQTYPDRAVAEQLAEAFGPDARIQTRLISDWS